MGAPKLNDKNIEKAVELLDGWTGKLTWERYLAILATQINHKYTKAAMLRHARIKDAWDHAKNRLQSTPQEGGYGNAALKQAKDRIHELEERTARLKRENDKLLEQFVRWANNAIRKGLSLEDLDQQTPRR
ncbi:hypothetical protein [Cellvibrio sp.]|uniref:hypothetical protein n=1 Tax=Cellvibrio sp. TaxID=1965322 RepID=UPI0039647586